MSRIIDALLQELEQEAQTTRRVLERVPADKLAWKPHDKSMSLGQLALHVATVPGEHRGNLPEIALRGAGFHPGAREERRGARAGAREERRAGAGNPRARMDDADLGKMWRVTRRPGSDGAPGRRRVAHASC